MLKSVNIKLNANAIVDTLRVEEKEEVIMDLKDITIMVITEKAILVFKKGFQKWLPKSTIKEPTEFVEGFFGHIVLTKDGEGWIPEESWDKYEPKKRSK